MERSELAIDSHFSSIFCKYRIADVDQAFAEDFCEQVAAASDTRLKVLSMPAEPGLPFNHRISATEALLSCQRF